MIIKPLYTVPQADYPPDVSLHGCTLTLEYKRKGKRYHSGIEFGAIAATQTRSERYFSPWHFEASYVLVEVTGSPWKELVAKDVGPDLRDEVEGMHHFAIKTADQGSFEIIADAWHLVPEQEGWPYEIGL